MSEDNTRKKYIATAVGLFILFAPIVLLSDWGLQKVQGYVDENKGTDWAPEWEARIATAYAWTDRPARSAKAWGIAATLYGDKANVEQMIQSRFQQALETEEVVPNGKYDALPIYDELAAGYPDHDLGQKSKGASQRIRLMSRP
jgi:hypothetical protein